MKKIMLAVFLLLLIPMAFATSWHTVAVMAMGISAALLAIIFMVGMGFGIQELRMMAKEEFFQLLAFGIMLAALAGTDGILNVISTNEVFLEGPFDTSPAETMQENAINIVNRNLWNMTNVLDELSVYDLHISNQASKASQCNIMQMGYSVSGCGGFTILAAPLSMSGGIVGFSIGELGAIRRLLELSSAFALPLILPLGILLRTLKMTRGAGGLLIALAISLHIALPMGIIFSDMLGETFLADPDARSTYGPGPGLSLPECNPSDASPDADGMSDNEREAIGAYYALKGSVRKYIFAVLVESTLGPVLSLLMVITSIKAITSVAGAEVDVSAISRFV